MEGRDIQGSDKQLVLSRRVLVFQGKTDLSDLEQGQGNGH
jgi:hypothetical protein